MPPEVVARLPVVVPNGALALESMVGISWLYLLTLYFQEVRGEDAQRTGLLFVPVTLASVAAAAVAGRAAVTFGLRRTAMAGLGLVIAGLLTIAGGMSSGSATLLVVVGMVVGEGGFMLANVPLTIAGTSSIENRRAGLAAGLLNTSIQLGSALGLAVVAVIVALVSEAAPSPDAGALRWGVLTCAVFCLLAFAIVTAGLHSPAPTRADEPTPPPTRSSADQSLGRGTVADVAFRARHPAVLMTKVLGQLRLQRGLQHPRGEPGQHPTRPGQRDAGLTGLRHQLLSQGV
jgi:MFS family permease